MFDKHKVTEVHSRYVRGSTFSTGRAKAREKILRLGRGGARGETFISVKRLSILGVTV